ncbi:nucleoside monophosphate kinase [Candidatus Dependentiae bacterium]|nr:nucleoside monophosphate kinase [Candidatus Dependentiae bacterium]
MNLKNKTIFTFLSAPGAGKGTLAQQVSTNLNYIVLSTGDLFRQHIANQTEIGKELKSYIDKGQLVPDDLTINMVKKWLLEQKESEKSIILDGCPRTAYQAQKILNIISKDMPNYKFRVVKLEIPQEEITQRLINRRCCPNKSCQAVYNTSMLEIASGKCPKCKTDLIQRQDDKPEVIAQRFDIYNKNEAELISAYKSAGINIEILNVSQKTPAQIFENFKKIL